MEFKNLPKVLGLDISTKTIGWALFDMSNRQLLELTHFTPKLKPKPEDKVEEHLLKATAFGEKLKEFKGLGIVDVMDYVKCDIRTLNTGMAASMGSVLLGVGTKGKRSSLYAGLVKILNLDLCLSIHGLSMLIASSRSPIPPLMAKMKTFLLLCIKRRGRKGRRTRELFLHDYYYCYHQLPS